MKPYNIWTSLKDGDLLCVTTNGYVRRDGRAVMGRGIARQVASYFPDLPKILGKALKKHGNQVYYLGEFFFKPRRISIRLLSFPVKPVIVRPAPDGSNLVSHLRSRFTGQKYAPGFAAKASPELILQSARQLRGTLLQVFRHDLEAGARCFLPWPGCGNGELSRDQVIPALREAFRGFPLPERVILFGRDGALSLDSLNK